MTTRTTRSARALVAASVSTVVAALSHTAGGGSTPSATTLALAFALAALAAIALSSRSLSLWRLILTVVIAQAGFHGLFQLIGTRSATLTHSHGAATPTLDGTSVMLHAATPMWWAHLFAAGVTVAALTLGERALLALLHLTRLVVSRLVMTLSPVVVATEHRQPVRTRPIFSPTLTTSVGVLRHRGPPSLL